METRTIEKELRRLFLILGFPLVLSSDNASHFLGEVDAMLAKAGVERLYSAPYNPRSVGKVETGVKIIGEALDRLASDDQDFADWPSRFFAPTLSLTTLRTVLLSRLLLPLIGRPRRQTCRALS